MQEGVTDVTDVVDPNPDVSSTVARARGEVGPTPGITVIAAPGAAAAAVMPGVRRTPGRPRGREDRGVKTDAAEERAATACGDCSEA